MKQIFTGITQFISGVFTGDLDLAWEGVKNIFKGTWNGIVSLLEGAVNLLIKGINWLISQLNKVSFDVPEWVPIVGGKLFGIAQTASELWKTLWRTKGTAREYGFDIAGTWYGPEREVAHSVDSGLYEQFGIGNAATAKLTLSLFADSIPRAAAIKRYVRLRNGEQASEWLPKGVFFTNSRSEEDGYWTVEAFDAMRKADQPWEPDQSLNFPLPMPAAVAEGGQLHPLRVQRLRLQHHHPQGGERGHRQPDTASCGRNSGNNPAGRRIWSGNRQGNGAANTITAALFCTFIRPINRDLNYLLT